MSTSTPFTVLDGEPTSPVILHVPHSATVIPGWVRDRIVLDDAALAVELGHMTDAGTDVVAFDAAARAKRQPWLLVNRLSRLVVDPERFPDEREEMRQVGMGAVYSRTSHGEELRPSDPAHEHDLLEAFFHPYAHAFTALVEQRLAETGRAVIIDVHSYPHNRLPYELHPHRRRPAVCLGVDERHTPWWLLTAATAALAPLGDVLVNEPFAGTYVPLRHYEAGDARVSSVMVELRRSAVHGRLAVPAGPAVDAGLARARPLAAAVTACLISLVDAAEVATA